MLNIISLNYSIFTVSEWDKVMMGIIHDAVKASTDSEI